MPNGHGKDKDKVQKERSFEIGMDEAYKANIKMIVEETLKHLSDLSHTAAESIKRNRSYVDKILSDNHTHDNTKQNIANQALQNAVETANMVSKQAVRHGDLAINAQWTYSNELAILLGAKTGAQADAFVVLLAKAIAEAMQKQK